MSVPTLGNLFNRRPLTFSYREELAKYDRLKKSYEDPTFEVVSGVFRALSGKKIIGAGSFQRYAFAVLLPNPESPYK